MTAFLYYVCTHCGTEYSREEVRYLCPKCSADYKPGIPLPGVLEAVFDYDKISAQWRINPSVDLFSAIETEFYPELPVGNTPYFQALRLSNALGMKSLWIKNDGLNPSGSLKDRASQLMVAEANRLNIDEIVTASTGNAASSLAAICASAGKKAVIFAPAKAPAAKLAQIKVHGAELHKVDGTYDVAFSMALQYSERHDCLNRNTAYHPLTIEGKKTVGLEIFLQNGMTVPDWVIVPVGDGVILSGVHKAFKDLLKTGLTKKMPHLLAVQAETSNAITNYWKSGQYRDATNPCTVADSISVTTPSNAYWAIRALKETDGTAIIVNDNEILTAQSELARLSGVFAEPSSSATLAGLKQALSQKIIDPHEQVVLLITGHGLKDIAVIK